MNFRFHYAALQLSKKAGENLLRLDPPDKPRRSMDMSVCSPLGTHLQHAMSEYRVFELAFL